MYADNTFDANIHHEIPTKSYSTIHMHIITKIHVKVRGAIERTCCLALRPRENRQFRTTCMTSMFTVHAAAVQASPSCLFPHTNRQSRTTRAREPAAPSPSSTPLQTPRSSQPLTPASVTTITLNTFLHVFKNLSMFCICMNAFDPLDTSGMLLGLRPLAKAQSTCLRKRRMCVRGRVLVSELCTQHTQCSPVFEPLCKRLAVSGFQLRHRTNPSLHLGFGISIILAGDLLSNCNIESKAAAANNRRSFAVGVCRSTGRSSSGGGGGDATTLGFIGATATAGAGAGAGA